MSDEPKALATPRPLVRGSVIGMASSVAAPATVIFAATSYFAGTVYQEKLFQMYGLPGGAIQRTLQATMADGYLAVLVVMTVCSVLSLIIIAIMKGFKRGELAFEQIGESARRPRTLAGTAIWLYVIGGFAGLGYICGYELAVFTYSGYRARVEHGCAQCFLYKTTRGQVVGIPVSQDERSTILATRLGVVVLPASSIKAIRPITTRVRLHGPRFLIG